MGLKFEQQKPRRLKRYFLGAYLNENFRSQYWYNCNLKRWEHLDNIEWGKFEYSNCAPCKTLRAFKRHLRKNPEMKGKLILKNRYISYDVFG